MAARNLEVDLEELGELHFAGALAGLSINNTCAVFAKPEIIGLLARGRFKARIAAAVHTSIARRTP